MEGKYLKLEKRQLEGRKTPVYLVVNKTTNETLAKLIFFPRWRKYVLETNEGIVFDEMSDNNKEKYKTLFYNIERFSVETRITQQ